MLSRPQAPSRVRAQRQATLNNYPNPADNFAMGLPLGSLVSARRWLLPGPVILLLVAALVSAIAVPETGETFGFVTLFVGQVAAGATALHRSRRLEPRERRAWVLYGLAILLAAGGVLAFGVWSTIVGDPPAFGLLDIFFLSGYVVLLAALARLARIDSDGSHWVTTILDALVGGVALSALVWNGFLHDLFDGRMASVAETVIGLSYPVLDIAIVFGVMILVIRRSHYHFDVRLVFVAVAMSIQVLSDFVYFSRGVGRSFAEAQPVWPLLLLAALFLLLSAAVVDMVPSRREFPERGASVWALMWPYLLATALLATHVVRYRSVVIDRDDVVLLDALIVIGVIIFLRQVYEISRNRRRVEEQRSELVASVSHELRTPLTAIVGYLTLLDEAGDEFPEDAKREMISEATAEARHMSRLVSDLVMLAKGSSSSLPLQITEVLVSGVVTAALRSVEADGVRIEERMGGQARVRVDADRLQQALTNLLTNAVRYGGDHVIVRIDAEGSDLTVEVHDSGPGVPTRFESVIWQRFERGANRFNASTPGLGIGLAIVRAVARSHGGTAFYRQSELLGGACFSLNLPGSVVRTIAEPRQVQYSG